MQKPTHLDDAITRSLRRRESQSTIRRLSTNHHGSIDFSSNDFLSLASSQELRRIFLNELQQGHSAEYLGSGGSRLLDGNSRYAEQLESEIATFHNAQAGLLCNSGFDANTGIFSSLPQAGDIIVFDEFIHASVHDGMRLSRAAKTICFKHNDVSALRSVLTQLILEDDLVLIGQRNVFVAVETVYSMDGDICPLTEIVNAVEELLPERNGHIIADEAHATALFGSKGRGIVCDLGLEDRIAVRLHTFGKALAANGAVILSSPLIRQYLINYARPLIYTTFMSYPALAAIKASYSYLQAGKTEQLARRVRHLSTILHNKLVNLQHSLRLGAETQHLLRVPADCPKTPIFAVLSSEPKELAAYCQSKGLVVRGIVPPTVPHGTERIRVCLHAGNTINEIDALIATIRSWVELKLSEGEGTTLMRARL